MHNNTKIWEKSMVKKQYTVSIMYFTFCTKILTIFVDNFQVHVKSFYRDIEDIDGLNDSIESVVWRGIATG